MGLIPQRPWKVDGFYYKYTWKPLEGLNTEQYDLYSVFRRLKVQPESGDWGGWGGGGGQEWEEKQEGKAGDLQQPGERWWKLRPEWYQWRGMKWLDSGHIQKAKPMGIFPLHFSFLISLQNGNSNSWLSMSQHCWERHREIASQCTKPSLQEPELPNGKSVSGHHFLLSKSILPPCPSSFSWQPLGGREQNSYFARKANWNSFEERLVLGSRDLKHRL